jgi:hypothetical protein
MVPTRSATATDSPVVVMLYQSLRSGLENAQPYALLMSAPSVVSIRLMPAAKMIGSDRIAQNDALPVAAPLDRASSPT